MSKTEIIRLTNTIHHEIRDLIIYIKNSDATPILVPVLKHIQRDITALELYDVYPLVVDFISVVRTLLKQAIVVHKQLYCNEYVQIDTLKTVLAEYDNLILQFKNEYYGVPEQLTDPRGRGHETTTRTSKK